MRNCLFGFFVIFLSGVALAANAPSFLKAKTFSVGKYGYANPVAEVVGDFNGDGHLDLAVANQGTGFLHVRGYVAVLLGNGDGTFKPGVEYLAGGVPQSIAVGDFNSDGKPDLVVGNQSSSNLSILLGNGDGTFQAHMDFGTVSTPESLAVGDFNNDGKVDVAAADANPQKTKGNVSIFLGNGDGTLQSPITSIAGGYIQAIAAGDFNGDGVLDIAVGNKQLSSFKGNLSILIGKGDGTFQLPVKYVSGDSVYFVLTADFNRDGHLDVALSEPGQTRVLLGNGDGTFGSPISSPGSNCPMATGDFNGDGILDMAVVNETNVALNYGAGDGSFQAGPEYYSGGSTASFAATADFDGDQRLDLAVTNKVDSNVGILLTRNRPMGQLASAPIYSSASGSYTFADFNADNHLDMAAISGTYAGGYTVNVLSGNGDGTFGNPTAYSFAQIPNRVVAGDFNHDGKPDLAVGLSDVNCANPAIAILLGTGTGSFISGGTFNAGGCSTFIAAADVNGDGKLDVVTLGSVLLGNGDGTFGTPLVFSSGLNTSIAQLVVADFNGDGRQDLAVISILSSTLQLLLGNGDGTFQNAISNDLGTLTYSIRAGDLNGDKKTDLALTLFDGQNGTSSLAVLLGNGDGSFQSAITYALNVEFGYDLAIADINRDGKPDVTVVGSSSTSDITGSADIFPGNGDGTLGIPFVLSIGDPYEIATADLNGDHVPDLVIDSSGAAVFINTTK